jgi:hypothetical protein
MTVTDFLLPVFVQVLLTFVLHALMGRERVGSIRRGEVKVRDIALREPNWTKRGTQFGNAYHNQLELPMLFYVLIAFILITKVGDALLLVLAWIFVLSRIVHAYIPRRVTSLTGVSRSIASGSPLCLRCGSCSPPRS